MSSTVLWAIAVGAGVAALGFGALALVLRSQAASVRPRPPEDRERETQQLRDAAWFAATLELDALALRMVEAGLSACRADGAAAAIRPTTGVTGAFEALHLAPAEVEWVSRGLQDETEAAIMRYPDVESQPGEERIKTAVFVPIPALSGEPSGTLAAVWRHDLGDEADERLSILESVADSAWPAIDNARRYAAAQALAERSEAIEEAQDTPERA